MRGATVTPLPLVPRETLARADVLDRETHRHELLDPVTLRWAAQLLTELAGQPAASVAAHLEDIAALAGRQLEVRVKDGALVTKRAVPLDARGARPQTRAAV
ncbi:MAG: hypothetical protein KF901_12915 [Myxococcales bacterium]|nr:hypothetical protein [Myxococcales bacterium]